MPMKKFEQKKIKIFNLEMHFQTFFKLKLNLSTQIYDFVYFCHFNGSVFYIVINLYQLAE